MDYSILNNDSQVTISLKGALIFSDTPAFSVVLDDIQKSAAEKCIVDLRELEHIDSSGLRMMLLVHDKCHEKQQALTFRTKDGFVHKALLHTKFDTIVDIRT